MKLLFFEKDLFFSSLLVFFVCLLYVFINPIFSPIDEGSHYEVILYMQKFFSLPIVDAKHNPPFYIAAHPPLYYIICSVFTFFITNLKVKLLLIRVLGGAMLSVSCYFTLKTLKLFYVKSVMTWRLAIVLSLFFYMCPGSIVRATTLTNEILAICFSSILFYYCHLVWNKSCLELKNVAVLFLLCFLAIFSKISTVVFIPVVAIIVYIKSYGKHDLMFYLKSILIIACLFGIILLPWFLYNLKTYHAFTAIKQQLEFTQPIVNPTGEDLSLNFVAIYFSGMVADIFWFPQEMPRNSWWPLINMTICFLSTILISYSLYSVIRQFFVFVRSRFSLKSIELSPLLLLVFWAVLIMICYSTLTLNHALMLGRYLYFCFPILIVVSFGLIKNQLSETSYKCVFGILFFLFLYWHIAYIFCISHYMNFFDWNESMWSPVFNV